jgi:thiol:disulfide interchange protein
MKESAMLRTLALSLLFSANLFAQGNRSFDAAVTKIEAITDVKEAEPGETIKVKVTVELSDGWHTYPTKQVDPQAQSQVTKFTGPEGPAKLGSIEDPAGFIAKPELDINIQELRYYEKSVTWVIPVIINADAKPGVIDVAPKTIKLLACDEMGCLPPRSIPLSAKLTVKATTGRAIPPTAKIDAPTPKSIEVVNTPKEEPRSVAFRLDPVRNYEQEMKSIADKLPKPDAANAGFWTFIFTAIFWGGITILTPCVFPMVPITVSVFLKQAEKHHSLLKMATIYTLTIIIVLGSSAIALLSTFSALAINPWTNVLLGILFVVFALSLFGMFELRMPSFLTSAVGSREGSGGVMGIIFMAISFTLVAFTCVAPFLGGFSGMAASGNFSTFQLAMGGLAFSTAFASPFFVLALFPALLKKLPKSGSWMTTMKVVMGFLEVAAALKFFRTAELRWSIPPVFFTYDLVLALWIALLFIAGLYLLGVFKMDHDDELHGIGSIRLMFAFFAIGLGVYLMPGLFSNGKERQRPAGGIYAWVDAFLLPEPSAAEIIAPDKEGLVWSADLKKALDAAKAENKHVFIDFTGVTCTNCKLNEKTAFTQVEIKELLKQYQLVQLYTDTVPEVFYTSPPGLDRQDQDALINRKFQMKSFGSEQLPLYIVLKPNTDGSYAVVGQYTEGKINNLEGFKNFLRESLPK